MSIQSDLQREKSKANGRYEDIATDVSSKAKELVDIAEEQVADIYSSGSKYVKSASRSVVDMAKDYPIVTAVSGIALGLFLGSKIFGSTKSEKSGSRTK